LIFRPHRTRSIVVLALPIALALALLLGALASCGRTARVVSGSVGVDDFGDSIHVTAPAKRVVSLSPVTTEILFAIGAGDRVVGRTHWDLYPAVARAVADLGNGMQPNVEAILGVHPDLVVLYAGSMNRAAAAQIRRVGIATIAIRTDTIGDFARVTMILARAVGDTTAGRRVVDSVTRSIDNVRQLPRPAAPVTVFWHIWDNPILTIGRGSYMNELTEIAGGKNVFADLPAASPQVTMEEVVRRNPDVIIAGPVNAKNIRASAAWQAVPAVRAGRILVVDTALVSRPGVRLGEAARHLRALIVGDSVR
jgi:ABC-type Fe3+-hydroxamate transport system substrate-binding protein